MVAGPQPARSPIICCLVALLYEYVRAGVRAAEVRAGPLLAAASTSAGKDTYEYYLVLLLVLEYRNCDYCTNEADKDTYCTVVLVAPTRRAPRRRQKQRYGQYG